MEEKKKKTSSKKTKTNKAKKQTTRNQKTEPKQEEKKIEKKVDSKKELEQTIYEPLPNRNLQLNDLFDKQEKSFKLKQILFPILLVILFGIFSFGIYRVYFTNPKRIMASSIRNLSHNMDELFDQNLLFPENFGKTFTFDGKVNLQVKSDLLFQEEDDDLVKTLFDRIQALDHHLTYQQDEKTKSSLLSLTSKKKDTTIFDIKILNQEKKEYLLVKNLLDTYLELGEPIITSDVLNQAETSLENYHYLYQFFIHSFTDHLDSKQFEVKDCKVKVEGQEKKAKKITFLMNATTANKLLKQIVEDLQKDKKSREIFKTMNLDVDDMKPKEIFSKEEELILSVYTTTLSYHPFQYEFIAKDSKNEYKISYSTLTEDILSLYSKEKLLGQLYIDHEEDKTKFTLTDAKKKEIGTIEMKHSNTEMMLEGNARLEGVDYRIKFDNELIKEDDSYHNQSEISLSATKGKQKQFDASITIDGTLKKGANIQEKVEKSIPIDQITDKQKEEISKNVMEIFLSLME